MEHIFRPGVYDIIDAIDANGKLHLRELVRQTNSQPYRISRLVNDLVTSGVLAEERVANSRFFSIQYTHPAAMSILLLRAEERIEKLPVRVRSALRDIATQHNHLAMVLFGSYVHGTARDESDVDVLAFMYESPQHPIDTREIQKKYGFNVNITVATGSTPETNHIVESGIPISGHTFFYRHAKRNTSIREDRPTRSNTSRTNTRASPPRTRGEKSRVRNTRS